MTGNTDNNCSTCGGQCTLFAPSAEIAGIEYSVRYCNKCGVGETLPRLDDLTLHELHSTQYYRNGEGVRFARPIELLVEGMRHWRVYRLTSFVRKGRVLDIGCGSGRFLLALRHSGWDVAGLELNDDTATSARNVHGLMVETSLGAFTDNSFDLITITHVLEHIREPRQMLRDCQRLLKPGGVIAVAVPNIESWQAYLTKGYWFHLDLPRHLWHFSEKWLSNELADSGFDQLAVRRLDLAHNIFGWLQSLLNVLGLRYNRLYMYVSKFDASSHYVSLFFSLVLTPLLLPTSVVLAFVEALFRAGGTVEIVARAKK